MSAITASRCGGAKNEAISLDWTIGGIIPPADGEEQQPGLAGAVAGVHHDVLLIAGGANFPDTMPWFGGKKKYQDVVYIFTKSDDGKLRFLRQWKLPVPLAYSAVASTPQGIVFAGGENQNGLRSQAGMLQWNNDSIHIRPLPDLPFALTNAAMTVHHNIVYLAGGETTTDALASFFCLDLNDTANGWRQLPALPQPTSHAVLVATSNSVYLIGGRKKNKNSTSDLYASVYAFDIKGNTWRAKQSLPYALSAGTGLQLDDQTIYLFGGDRGETFRNTETLIGQINAEVDSVRKEALNQAKIKLQSTHPGFSREVLAYNLQKDEWKKIDSIPFVVPVTTAAIRWDDDIVIPSGEIRAGVRTPQVLVGKLKP